MTVLEHIQRCFAAAGPRPYAGEAVTQLEHALQTASLAQQDGAAPTLMAAALLHDIGHMRDKRDEALAARGVNARHEECGASYLKKWFAPSVIEPVRLHVVAKAYLCAVEPDYYQQLSSVSKRSLRLQGGVMSKNDAEEFLTQPFAAEAVQLRRWDDRAKDPRRMTPSLEHFLAIAESVMVRH